MESNGTCDPHIFEWLCKRNVPLILEKMFFYLDYESFKTCLKVSKAWNDLLRSKSYREKAKCVFESEIYQDGRKLSCASEICGIEEVRRILSEEMVDVNTARGFSGGTPFMEYAALNGHEEVFKLILDYGAQINKTDNQRTPLLHKAVNLGDQKIVQMILNGGAEVDLADSMERTPLYYAFKSTSKCRSFPWCHFQR